MRRRKITFTKPYALHVDRDGYKLFIGVLDVGRRVFTKHVRESKHLFLKLDAWGIDADTFTTKLKPLKVTIRVVDDETGVTYQVPSAVFEEHGQYLHFKTGETTHHAQIFLPRSFWMRIAMDPGKGESKGTMSNESAQREADRFFDSLL